MAVLRSFVASCALAGVEPFAWLQDALTRVGECSPNAGPPLAADLSLLRTTTKPGRLNGVHVMDTLIEPSHPAGPKY